MVGAAAAHRARRRLLIARVVRCYEAEMAVGKGYSSCCWRWHRLLAADFPAISVASPEKLQDG